MNLAIVALGVLMLGALAYASRRTRRVASETRVAAAARRAPSIRTSPAPDDTTPQKQNDAEASSAQDATSHLATTFCDVVERYKLPPLPSAVTLAMNAMREPDIELDRICRIIATDPALAGRIVSLSRSPLYALRRSPQTLLEATTVLGLNAARRILVTAGMDMMHKTRSPHFQQLWHHGLATAIAAQMLARRPNAVSSDHAYLAGLLHDIGQVVLLQSNEAHFLDCWCPTGDATAGCHAEHAAYGRDHAFIGASILYQWKIDDEIVDAVLKHHDGYEAVEAQSAVLALADYVARRAGFGFVTEPPTPPDHVLAAYACLTDEAMAETIAELQSAFTAELALLR